MSGPLPSSLPAAFLAGLVTSLHCAGMCGPLACAILPMRREGGDGAVAAGTYHLARLTAYATLGALAGALGRLPLELVPPAVRTGAAWAGVVALIALALRWDRRWRWSPPGARRLFRSLPRRGTALAPAAVGLCTPLLPCGPLYLLVSVALLSGSGARGAELLLCFGLGTLPLLWAAQSNLLNLHRRLSPAALGRLRVALALAAAAVAAWRLRGSLGFSCDADHRFLCL